MPTGRETRYDAIVLGAGGVGSAALYHLARRGARAVALDRFTPPHDRGSSHGQSRIIRQAYFEHADYVPLVLRAYALWDELARVAGEPLRRETGLLEIGPPEGIVVPGVLRAARDHGLEVETLSAGDIARRFPGFNVPSGMSGVYERRAGWLPVERCVQAHLDCAARQGGELRGGVAVAGWSSDGRTVVVRTAGGDFEARSLVIAAGAWAPAALADLGLPLVVRRKPQFWYRAAGPAGDRPHGVASAGEPWPAFLYELPEGMFYGLPPIDERGVKLAEHTGGETVLDPAAVDRGLRDADRAAIERFAARCLPRVGRDLLAHSVCLYTMTPDEHFVVDRHPRWPNVVLAAGLSGHGFKFAAALGEVLADLALEGSTALPIGFLGIDRPGLRR